MIGTIRMYDWNHPVYRNDNGSDFRHKVFNLLYPFLLRNGISAS